jgi:hypothetical protein
MGVRVRWYKRMIWTFALVAVKKMRGWVTELNCIDEGSIWISMRDLLRVPAEAIKSATNALCSTYKNTFQTRLLA